MSITWNELDNLMNQKIDNEYKISCVISKNENIKQFMVLVFFLFIKIFYSSLKILFLTFNSEYYQKGSQGNSRSDKDKRRLLLNSIIPLFKAHFEEKPPSIDSISQLENDIKENKVKLNRLILNFSEENLDNINKLKAEINSQKKKLEIYKSQDYIPTTYINKPGINFDVTGSAPAKDIEKLIRYIEPVEETDMEINLDQMLKRFSNYPLSSLMGSLYEITTNASIFLIVYIAQIYNNDLKQIINVNGSIDFVLNNFKFVYGLPDDFKETDFVNLISKIIPEFPLRQKEIDGISTINFIKRFSQREISSATNIENNIDLNMHSFLLDLFTDSAKGIILRNMTNKPYLRTRVPPEKRSSSGSETIPKCPEFLASSKESTLMAQKDLDVISSNKPTYVKKYPNTYKITYGRNWYPVNKTSIQNAIFDMYERKNTESAGIHPTVNAGYSGSTFMWINFVYNLMGVPKSNLIDKYLLAAIVSDFVPIYHSLPEVLIVFSQEILTREKRYTLNQIPIEYLYNYLNDSTYTGTIDIKSFDEYFLKFTKGESSFKLIKTTFKGIIEKKIDFTRNENEESISWSGSERGSPFKLTRTKTLQYPDGYQTGEEEEEDWEEEELEEEVGGKNKYTIKKYKKNNIKNTKKNKNTKKKVSKSKITKKKNK